MWEPGSFDAHKNAAAPIIAILGRLELDTEVSDADMETAESDNCRGMSKKNGDANGVLATTPEELRMSSDGKYPQIQSLQNNG